MSKTVIATPWHNNKAIISFNDQNEHSGTFGLGQINMYWSEYRVSN